MDIARDEQTILIVDDTPEYLDTLRNILSREYRVLVAPDGPKALKILSTQVPDLVLLDVLMPGMDGYEVCRQIRAQAALSTVPVIFLTGSDRIEDEEKGFSAGAVDYITKPFHPHLLMARVRTHLALHNQAAHLEMLVQERTQELQDARIQIILRLGVAAEFKDNETGQHVLRVGLNSALLARACGMPENAVEILRYAAPMHDIGKIGIPDSVLLKPGPLTEQEWKIIQQHPRIGAKVLGESTIQPLRMAREVALSHHEKWNGSGYPFGLRGDQIPFTGRIVAIVDVFDALTSDRPYKKAWSIEDAAKEIIKLADTHFDPDIVKCFSDILPEMAQIRYSYSDVENLSPEPS